MMLKITKKRFLYIFVIFFLASLFLISAKVTANYPSSMSLSYNSSTKVLDVTITHNIGSDSPNDHYIKLVEIKLNGSTIISQPYTSQPNTNTFTYQYNMTAGDGAPVQVTATCNKFGDITRSIIIGDDSGNQNGSTEISGYLGFLIITSLALIVLLPLIYRKIKIRII
ncbi:MAG: hypothetical protein ACFFDG_01300 [Promethearchaeota archaeon]